MIVCLFAVACLLLPALPGTAAPERVGVNLLTNPGFETGTSTMLTGWEKLGDGGSLDATIAHTGKHSLRVTSPNSGMRSVLLPYSGGRLRVSGWVKTRDVVTGERPWNKAALQLISYDKQRKAVGHSDVALVGGTHDWAHYDATFLFSRDVAFVSVYCHLWGAQTKGTAWFDDVSLELLDDPRTLPHRPLDLKQATVTVNFSKDLGEFRHLWIGSDVGYSDRVLTPTQIGAMQYARRDGFLYVRMHDCIHDPHIYSEDAQGNPVYHWDAFDARIQTIVGNGMRPVVVLETMPPPLATHDDGKGWTNPYPPKGPREYLKWQHLIRALVAHCEEKWGPAIHDWYFEVWNEPSSDGYFRGTQEQYLKIYDHAVAGATAADPDIRIGGPADAGTGWIQAFLQHCRSGYNDATGGIGCRVDFLSWHIYTVGVGIPVFDNIRLSLNTVRGIVKQFPQYSRLPLIITEWGCASSNNPVHDRPYDAAFRTMAVHEFLDAGITLALPFCLGEGPQYATDGFTGGLALITKTTIPKPSFHTFELLDRMVGRRVVCESSNDPVGGLACLSPDHKRAWVMLYNLIENPQHAAYDTAVTVRLHGLPAGAWHCVRTAIAPGICDPFVAWQAMGSPATLTAAQRAALLKASTLPAPVTVPINAEEMRVQMPGFSVMMLELTS